MQTPCKTRSRSEEGIALLIAIFVLLLISVVAIALLLSTGTETALGANYRSSSTVYYAALAGLEEARGRLLPSNPNYFGAAAIPSPFPQGQTVYMLNRLSGETVAPWDSSNQYYDKEYNDEFGVQASSATWQPAYSVWDSNAQGVPGPVYKWVRINAATKQSLFIDVDNTGLTLVSVYNQWAFDAAGNFTSNLTTTVTPFQALQITALAELPNGSQKYLQDVVAPVPSNLAFPSAITLDGTGVQYTGPGTAQFKVDGTDQNPAAPNAPPNGCTPGATTFPAVGYLASADSSNIHATPPGNYTGSGAAPSLAQVTVAPNLQSVPQLNNLIQNLTAIADYVIAGPATQANMPSGMTASNPKIVVVDGDLDLNSWHNTGYGILLVTGQLKYDPDAYWNGIVLVIGKGKFTYENNGLGSIYGALLIAQTVDSSGNPLASPGAATVAYSGGNGGVGVYYSSCWVNYVQRPVAYKVLSFHEIRQ